MHTAEQTSDPAVSHCDRPFEYSMSLQHNLPQAGCSPSAMKEESVEVPPARVSTELSSESSSPKRQWQMICTEMPSERQVRQCIGCVHTMIPETAIIVEPVSPPQESAPSRQRSPSPTTLGNITPTRRSPKQRSSSPSKRRKISPIRWEVHRSQPEKKDPVKAGDKRRRAEPKERTRGMTEYSRTHSEGRPSRSDNEPAKKLSRIKPKNTPEIKQKRIFVASQMSVRIPQPPPPKFVVERSGNRQLRNCLLSWCKEKTLNFKRHVTHSHLPAIMNCCLPLSGDLTRTRYAFLVTLIRASLGPSKTLLDAVSFLNRNNLVTEGAFITEEMSHAMEALCIQQGWPVPRYFEVLPINSPAALLHWRVLVPLMERLAPEVCEELRKDHAVVLPSLSIVRTQEEPLPEIPVETESKEEMQPIFHAYDSHFHMDRLKHALKLRGDITLRDIEVSVPDQRAKDYYLQVTGATTVYCDPKTLPSFQELSFLQQNNIKAAIGAHPKKLYTVNHYERVGELLQHPNVVGLGEIGLDFSVPDTEWPDQMEKAARCLEFLDTTKVLVLHLRGVSNDHRSANYFCLDLLRYRCRVSSQQKIQLHCFAGSPEVVKMWRETYPETRFSFSGMVTKFSQSGKEGLRHVPLEKMLIETDAPYFPVVAGVHVSAPHFLDETAATIASIRGNSSMEEVLEYTEKGAWEFFQ